MASPFRVLLISGSLRRGSTNTALLATAHRSPPPGVTAGALRRPRPPAPLQPRRRRRGPAARSRGRRAAPGDCRLRRHPLLHPGVRRRPPRLVQEPPRLDGRRRGDLRQAGRLDQRLGARRADPRRRRPRRAPLRPRLHRGRHRRGRLPADRAHPRRRRSRRPDRRSGDRRRDRRRASGARRPRSSAAVSQRPLGWRMTYPSRDPIAGAHRDPVCSRVIVSNRRPSTVTRACWALAYTVTRWPGPGSP